jgi:hypothetical protein
MYNKVKKSTAAYRVSLFSMWQNKSILTVIRNWHGDVNSVTVTYLNLRHHPLLFAYPCSARRVPAEAQAQALPAYIGLWPSAKTTAYARNTERSCNLMAQNCLGSRLTRYLGHIYLRYVSILSYTQGYVLWCAWVTWLVRHLRHIRPE